MKTTKHQHDTAYYLREGLAIVGNLLPTQLSLYSGKLGHLLLAAYTYRLTEKDGDWQRTSDLLDDVLAQLQGEKAAMPLHSANLLMSLHQVLAALREEGIADVSLGDETMEVVDELAFRNCRAFLLNRNIDFLYGAAGGFHYLSGRVQANAAVTGYLEELVEELLATKLEDERGVRFYNAHIARMNDSEDINLGLAHGQCGLILALLEVYRAGVRQASIKKLIEGMVCYILHLRQDAEPGAGYHSLYPARMDETKAATHPENRAKYNSRMGWCYGDLNIALVLYRVHRILRLPDLLRWADEVGQHAAARRTLENAGVEQPHLCHGAASMVLMYQALQRECPLPAYQEAKDFWLGETLTFLKDYLSGGGYETDQHAGGLLMGIPGILLVLISEELQEETAWQQILLV